MRMRNFNTTDGISEQATSLTGAASPSYSKKKKAIALSAAGLVLVAGVTVTSLAAWTDTEWIWGAGEGAAGVGTSAFEVQQNVALTGGVWVDAETNPGQQISFGVGANSMAPGDTQYAFVRLQTTENSDPGELTLNEAIAGDGSNAELFAALEYEAKLMDSADTCTSTAFSGTGTSLVAAGSALTTGASLPFALLGKAANEQTVCFALTLPAGEADNQVLQGKIATPVWNFAAISS